MSKILLCPICASKKKLYHWNKIESNRIQCSDCQEIFQIDEVQTVEYIEKLKKWIKKGPIK
jgi:transcription elongation factor Elf1